MTDINIENIIAFAQISDGFDIKMLSEKLPDCSYNPDEFDGLTMKFDKPKIAILILSNGKAICTGAKSIKEVEKAIDKAIERIESTGSKVKKKFTIVTDNIVVSADFKKKLDLRKISKNLKSQNVDYDPKSFPGLIYRIDKHGPVLILFENGKVVCNGLKTEEDASNTIKMLEEKLKSMEVI